MEVNDVKDVVDTTTDDELDGNSLVEEQLTVPEEVKEETIVPDQPRVNYFTTEEPFNQKKISNLAVSMPGYLDKEKKEILAALTESIKNSEVEDIKKLKQVLNATFDNSEASLSAAGGAHQNRELEDLNNVVTYANDELNTKKATFKKTNDMNTNAALFLSYAKSMSGMGTSVSVPLWNSGIWITMTVPKDIDVLYAMERLQSEAMVVGINTGLFIGTMHDSAYYNIVVDFILSHIQRTSVKLDNKNDVVNYILISDLQTLINGLVTAMYPDGYSVNRTCKNYYVIQADAKPKCNFTTTGVINPALLVFKNNKDITEEMIVHMAKRRDNAVSIEEVLHYQNTLNPANKTKVISFKDENYDMTYDITFYTPSIAAYQNSVNIWAGDLERDLSLFLEDGDDKTVKLEKANKLMNSNYLSHFLTYIKDIKQTKGATGEFLSTEFVSDDLKNSNIKGLLEMMSPINNIVADIELAVRDYINTNTVAIVGLPNYICPNCLEQQATKTGKAFDNVIPLDMMKLFFILSQIRTREITS